MSSSIFDQESLQAGFYEYLSSGSKPEALIVRDEKEAVELAAVAELLDYPFYRLPDFRADYLDDLRSFNDELLELSAILNDFYADRRGKKCLILPLSTATKYLPVPDILQKRIIEFGETLNLNDFKSQLLYWGYDFVEIVEQSGEVSFRGDIIDIYSGHSESGVRISLFDDQIESIRYFDTATQKSLPDELESVTVLPALFSLTPTQYDALQSLVDASDVDTLYKDIHSLGFWYLPQLGLAQDLTELLSCVMASDLSGLIDETYLFNENGFIDKEHLKALPVLPEAKQFKPLALTNATDLIEYHKEKKITVVAKNEAVMRQHGIEPSKSIKLVEKNVIVNLISDEELILSLNKKTKKRKKRRPTVVLDELKNGDYVVHEQYGVGVFEGLEQVSVLGGVRDFAAIIYAGDDKLLLPVENLHMIDRYVADSGNIPLVDKLGKGSFQKLKTKVKQKLYEIANEIIQRAAARELIEAKQIKEEIRDMDDFMRDSGFEYTKDQVRSIAEIKEDLQSGKVMDRLLSGDVGFGKTEVAMNALFMTVRSGMQAAIIVPTTLLSNQHYHTVQERFRRYDIAVAKIDRFTTAAEKKNYMQGLKDGTYQVAVGTHALLGVQFNNLGLMIIDEEHKFGVKQKEELKEKSKHLHLLSMSATPIPRSLNMALSSIKGYSQLTTPPSEREDVRTYVKEYDDKLLKEAVHRELRRGGQLFYVFNRIEGIEQKKAAIQKILPKLRILVLHSKIPATTSEKELVAFAEGKYDMLISTTIIESGIHMPNVNTIIIDGANNFGIADLHQLRGRVGRGSRQGYCYFLIEDKDKLTDDAKKRLMALESNSFLGSGAVLAFHDLEIRGGGNLIGEAQSGHVKNIGYSLYLKMLEDAIMELSNKQELSAHVETAEIKLTIRAYITAEYIAEDKLRLDLYRRLSRCKSTVAVYELEEEMIDRFGKLDEFSKQFIDLTVIKILATDKKIQSVSNYGQNITLQYHGGKKEMLKAESKDDDDILKTTLQYLRK